MGASRRRKRRAPAALQLLAGSVVPAELLTPTPLPIRPPQTPQLPDVPGGHAEPGAAAARGRAGRWRGGAAVPRAAGRCRRAPALPRRQRPPAARAHAPAGAHYALLVCVYVYGYAKHVPARPWPLTLEPASRWGGARPGPPLPTRPFAARRRSASWPRASSTSAAAWRACSRARCSTAPHWRATVCDRPCTRPGACLTRAPVRGKLPHAHTRSQPSSPRPPSLPLRAAGPPCAACRHRLVPLTALRPPPPPWPPRPAVLLRGRHARGHALLGRPHGRRAARRQGLRRGPGQRGGPSARARGEARQRDRASPQPTVTGSLAGLGRGVWAWRRVV